MQHSQFIFAGLDATGELRFVGDVPRGAACGCTCASCGAPLIARRGELRTWHFAHEASQERPECFAGAINLLRRLAIHRLQTRGVLMLAPIKFDIRTAFPSMSEQHTWTPPSHEVGDWDLEPAQNAPAACVRLASGTRIGLFVAVGPAESRFYERGGGEGALLYSVPLPAMTEQLQDLSSAQRHIDNHGRLKWLHCPDAELQRRKAAEDLNRRARSLLEETAALRRIAEMAAPPPGRWAPNAVPRGATHAPAWATRVPFQAPTPVPMPILNQAATIAPANPAVDTSPWSSWRKFPHAFMFYGLKDGSAWLLFPHRDGRHMMAPYPHAFDGWDEAMPAHVAKANSDLGCYALVDRLQTMVFLGNLARMIRSASNWEEVLALPWVAQT